MRAYAERIGLRSIVNRMVGEHQRAFDPGLLVLGMVVDTLSCRSPLYHLESFFEGKDTEVLLGEKVDASVFNDDNAGAMLDLLYEAGTQKVYSEATRRRRLRALWGRRSPPLRGDASSGPWRSPSRPP